MSRVRVHFHPIKDRRQYSLYDYLRVYVIVEGFRRGVDGKIVCNIISPTGKDLSEERIERGNLIPREGEEDYIGRLYTFIFGAAGTNGYKATNRNGTPIKEMI